MEVSKEVCHVYKFDMELPAHVAERLRLKYVPTFDAAVHVYGPCRCALVVRARYECDFSVLRSAIQELERLLPLLDIIGVHRE